MVLMYKTLHLWPFIISGKYRMCKKNPDCFFLYAVHQDVLLAESIEVLQRKAR